MIYFIVTQGMFLTIRKLQKNSTYYKKTNMLFVSNLQAKGNSHAHIIYLLSILLLAVFVGTSVLYSSYYNVEEDTEAVYPYSFQYISLPNNSATGEQKDIEYIENTLNQEGDYISYQSAFKTDEERRIGFMSNSNFSALGSHELVTLEDNEYYVVAGNKGIVPNSTLIKDYLDNNLQLKGIQEKVLLSTGLQNVYFILPNSLYETMNYPEYKVFAYELDNWTDKIDVAKKIESQIPIEPDERLLTSKISLYDTETFVKSVLFFIGFMLSLIFLSAAMSILYFYLQTSLAGEREKYIGIRKIGLSLKEISSVVTRELAILIFVPFIFATILLFTVLFSIQNVLSPAFFQMTKIGVGIFLVLFILSFIVIRKTYLRKLIE